MAAGLPRIDGKSHNTCSIDGNVQLYLHGKFPADAQVVFDDLAGWRANGLETRRIDGGDIQVLVCKVPPYEGQRSTRPKQVKLKVQGARQDSQQHNFTYTPSEVRYDFVMKVDKHELTKQEFNQELLTLIAPFVQESEGPAASRLTKMRGKVEELSTIVVFRVNDNNEAIDGRNSIAVEAYLSEGFLADVGINQHGAVNSPRRVAVEAEEPGRLRTSTNEAYHILQDQSYPLLGIKGAEGLTEIELCNMLDRTTVRMLHEGNFIGIEELLEAKKLARRIVMLRFMGDCMCPNNLCQTTGDGGYGAWERHTRVLMSFAAMWLIMDVLSKENLPPRSPTY